jgi:hypothetical protein
MLRPLKHETPPEVGEANQRVVGRSGGASALPCGTGDLNQLQTPGMKTMFR